MIPNLMSQIAIASFLYMTRVLNYSPEIITSQIFLIRNQKVMLDSDLAVLYGVTTARLNQQVSRNRKRFPPDFMFQLTKQEFEVLMLQFATSKRGGRRKLPYVFTEHGAVMLASVLNSETAVAASIQVVRAFVKLREIISGNKTLAIKIKELEKLMTDGFNEHDEKFRIVFEAIQQLIEKKSEPRKAIGYKIGKQK
jgi:hypothetical protein